MRMLTYTQRRYLDSYQRLEGLFTCYQRIEWIGKPDIYYNTYSGHCRYTAIVVGIIVVASSWYCIYYDHSLSMTLDGTLTLTLQ